MKLYVEKIRYFRKQKKITLSKLSKLIGKSLRTVASWESKKRVPTESDVRVLAQILEVNVKNISNLRDFYANNILSCHSLLTPIERVQRQIKSSLTIEEKGWISGLLSKIDLLSSELTMLKNERNNFQTIINSLQLLIYQKNEKLKFTFINPVFSTFYQLSQSEILGKDNKNIFPLKEAESLTEFEKEALTGKTISNIEITIPGSNNNKKGLLSISPFIDINGKIAGITAIIEDITEIITVKEQFKLIEHVINEANEVFWIKKLTPIPSFTFISKSFSNIFGYSTDFLYKNPDFYNSLIHNTSERKRVLKFYSDNKEGYIEYKIKTLNAEEKYIVESRRILPNLQIEFGIFTDITEKKKDSFIAELLKYGLDEVEDPIWIHTSKPFFKYYYVNRALLKLYGYSRKDFLKNINIWKEHIHPDEKKYVINHYKKIGEVPETIQYRIISKDGFIHHVDEKVMFAHFAGKKYCYGILRILKSIRNISSR